MSELRLVRVLFMGESKDLHHQYQIINEKHYNARFKVLHFIKIFYHHYIFENKISHKLAKNSKKKNNFILFMGESNDLQNHYQILNEKNYNARLKILYFIKRYTSLYLKTKSFIYLLEIVKKKNSKI